MICSIRARKTTGKDAGTLLSRLREGFAGPRIGIPAAALAIAVMLASAMARDTPASQDGLCSGSGSTLDYKNCLHQRYLAADKDLNRLWKRVIAEIRKSDYLEPALRGKWEARMREAQRNWVQFKDIDCNEVVLYEWWGGSGAGGAISLCLFRHTVLRTQRLGERYFPDG